MEVIVTIDNRKADMTMLERMELIDRIQKQMQSISRTSAARCRP